MVRSTLISESLPYQVGGSLPPEAMTYVDRQADRDLLANLQQGEFCYVFNARQMGKSSLRVRTVRRLEQQGIRCGTIDLTEIGTQQITLEQWYAAIAAVLVKRLRLQVNLVAWWCDRSHLSGVNRLSEFLETILLVQIQEPVVIFVDEIDTVLSLKFATHDFFALVRMCFNKRTEQLAYRRLTFCLMGVTTPNKLIADRQRTPFNIGQAIALQGLQTSDCGPLLIGLSPLTEADAVLNCILNWTNGQPFLTQKLCQHAMRAAIAEAPLTTPSSPQDWVAPWVDQLVMTTILHHWESRDEPEHLQTIRDRLLAREQQAGRLLGLYQQILLTGSIPTDDSWEQMELILSGLVEKRQDCLQIKNRIYQEVFNADWVDRQLSNLRPYAEAFNAWIGSEKRDESRLLRGQALQDAQHWTTGKHLSDEDYQFLSASERCDRREVQQALEAERVQAIQASLRQAQKVTVLQRGLLLSLTGSLLLTLGIAAFNYWEYRQASVSEIKALANAARGLFLDYKLDALLSAIRAKRMTQTLGGVDPATMELVDQALQQSLYSSQSFNRLAGHRGGVLAVALNPKAIATTPWMATGSNDKTVKLWYKDGRLANTLVHSDTVFRVRFSANGQTLVASTLDGQIYRWRVADGVLLQKFQAHAAPVWGVALSPDGQLIASASADRTVKLWRSDGTYLRTFSGHTNSVWSVAFSPGGQTLASAGLDGKVNLWTLQGQVRRTLSTGQSPVWDVAFCPRIAGQPEAQVVSVSSDGGVRLWQMDGKLVQDLSSGDSLRTVDCQAGVIVAGGNEAIVRLWRTDGRRLGQLPGHRSVVRSVALARDGKTFVSVSEDSTAKLWRLTPPVAHSFHGHPDTVWTVATSADSRLIASADDSRAKVWSADGRLLYDIPHEASNAVAFSNQRFSPSSGGGQMPLNPLVMPQLVATGGRAGSVDLWLLAPGQLARSLRRWEAHDAEIMTLTFSPDGQTIASAGDDQRVKLWTATGQLQWQVLAHPSRIWTLAFSPDGQILASAGEDNTVKLWSRDGQALATLQGHQGPVWGVAFSPQGDRLVSASRDDTLRIWRVSGPQRGQLLRTIPAHSQGLTRVAWSPDGKAIAAATVDNQVKLWNPEGQLLKTLPGHVGMVVSVAFSPNGQILASGGDDGAVMI